MDPDVVGENNLFDDLYRNTIIDDLQSLPTLSLVFDPDDILSIDREFTRTQRLRAIGGNDPHQWSSLIRQQGEDGLSSQQRDPHHGRIKPPARHSQAQFSLGIS